MAHGVDSCNFEHLLPCTPPHRLETEARKSDYMLSETGERELRNTRDHVQRTIAQPENELDHLQTIMDGTIQTSNGVLKSQIVKLDLAIAPHKKLPPELLSIIFLYCVKPFLGLRLRLRHGSDHAPSMTLSLAAVCSSWREVAISTPALWKRISISYSLYPDTGPARFSAFGQRLSTSFIPNQSSRLSDPPFQSPSSSSHDLWYKDALSALKKIISWGTRIIQIRADTIATPSTPFPVSLDPFLNLLFPYASQFTQITLIGILDLLLPFITASPPAFDALESISIQIDGEGDGAFVTSPRSIYFAGLPARTVFQNAPQLREFILSGYLFYGNTRVNLRTPLPSVFDLQWAELTRLSVQGVAIDVTNAHLIIAQCARMTNFQLSIDNARVETPLGEIQGRIHHQYLLSLVVLSLEESHVEVFLQPLVLPSLEKLELGSNDAIRRWQNRSSAAGCISLCNRSKCILRTLRAPFTIVESHLQGFLTEFWSLRELYLQRTWLSDTVMIEIAQGNLLPNLEGLECFLESTAASLGHLMNMILHGGKGMPGSTGIRSVTAYYSYTAGLVLYPNNFNEALRKFVSFAKEVRPQGCIITLARWPAEFVVEM
ncbi:hypothetical protein D9615_008139 [Tricholomella constricta]|uniref:F-box domain-containing protein n=1 Tax=Tricholomella constricta TaxID=117010 RepID=A0A8H5GVI6_9AGAR|nr:hypothetical protein D9615_008139 [Tricholomella constricta]